jgi:hypothetical protein
MSGNQQHAQSSDDQFIWWVVLSIIGLMVALWLLRFYEPDINALLGTLAWAHIAPFAWLEVQIASFGWQLPFLADAGVANRFLSQTAYSAMNGEQRWLILTIAGRYGTPIYALAGLYLALRGTRFRPDQLYTVKPTLDWMIDFQANHWKTIQPFRQVNPAQMKDIDPPDLAAAMGKRRADLPPLKGSLVLSPEAPAVRPGDWTRALKPEEWLVATGHTHDQAAWEGQNAELGFDPVFRRRWGALTYESVAEVLAAQLTTEWKGFDALRPYQQALCAVFALFYAYKNSAGEKLLNELSVLFANKGRAKLDDLITGEKRLYRLIKSTLIGSEGKHLAAVASKHAWRETAFVAMIGVARKDRGVLAAAQFNWLKQQDRALWYALNSAGGDAFLIESAGVMAHFKAEQQVGAPLRRPAVYQASRSLIEDYLDMRPDRVAKREKRALANKTVNQLIQESIAESRAQTLQEQDKK